MLVDILLGVVFTVFGVYLGVEWPKWKARLETSRFERQQRRRAELLAAHNVTRWIVNFYLRAGAEDDLYECDLGGGPKRIPFLTSQTWCKAGGSPFHTGRLQYDDGPTPEFVVDEQLVEARRALGSRLFESPTVYLRQCTAPDTELQLVLGRCQYLEMFTLLASLEEETFAAVDPVEGDLAPLRSSVWPNLATAATIEDRPVSVGVQCAITLAGRNGREFVLNMRSAETVTYSGKLALMPCFGLSPVPQEACEDLLRYNIVKEFCEELFDRDELIEEYKGRRAAPLWFYSLPEAVKLLEGLRAGTVEATWLGGGFDGLNGSFTVAVLLDVRDHAVSEEIHNTLVANWESKESSYNEPTVVFEPIDSPRLAEWLAADRLHYGSAFAIAQARMYLRDPG